MRPVRTRVNDEDVGRGAVRHVGLRALKDVVIAVAGRRRGQREHVRAGALFGDGVRPDPPSGAEFGQYALLQGGARVLDDRHHAGEEVRGGAEEQPGVLAAKPERL